MQGESATSILKRIVSPDTGDLSETAAETFLRITFTEVDQDRIQELAEKNTESALSPEQRREYEGYVVVGELLALMQAKARQSLRNRPSAAA